MIGGQGSSYLAAGETQLSLGYRWQHSDRHFRGDHEERDRQAEHSEVVNDIHLLDFGVTHALTRRFSVGLSLPVLIATRSQPIRSNGEIVGRFETHATGIGDLSASVRGWLLDPDEYETGNALLGLGVKFPTGEDDVRDWFEQSDGTREYRTVDQSIQPGDGGYGIVADLNAFKTIGGYGSLYAQGSYLANPEAKNGVPTFRRNEYEAEMSVADQFLARAGGSLLIPWHGLGEADSLSLTLGARAEGVPVRDLFGSSRGFRRPGIAVSIEPGLVYSYKKVTFGLTTPVAVYRNRWRSVPDKKTPGRHGDAAFADVMVLFGVNFRFGGHDAPPHLALRDLGEPGVCGPGRSRVAPRATSASASGH